MSKLWDDLFGSTATADALPGIPDNMLDASIYNSLANNYGAAISGHNSMLGHANAIKQNLPPRPAPEPKDIPALAISLDTAYDLWAAKYGYEWVNINGANPATQQRYQMGLGAYPTATQAAVPGGWVQATGTFTVTVDDTPSEPEFDWYTVARRLVHVRALENEGGYYRLVPKEWCR